MRYLACTPGARLAGGALGLVASARDGSEGAAGAVLPGAGGAGGVSVASFDGDSLSPREATGEGEPDRQEGLTFAFLWESKEAFALL